METEAQIITPHDRRIFWRDELFDFGFPAAVTALFTTYRYDWGAIIPDLYYGKLKSQTDEILAPLPPFLCEQTLRQLLGLALHRNGDSRIAQKLREALRMDGLVSELPMVQSGNTGSVYPAAAESLVHSSTSAGEKEWDVFISHASEDKEEIAHPLAAALHNSGIQVWYDQFALSLGDSLRASIDRGLAQSKYGVVILSHYFFSKRWPQRELNGLTAIEIGGRKVILPVWHRISRDEVAGYSPVLADKVSISTDEGLDKVVHAILSVVNPDAANTGGPSTSGHSHGEIALPDKILSLARIAQQENPRANALEERVICEHLNETPERIANAMDALAARGRAKLIGHGMWFIYP